MTRISSTHPFHLPSLRAAALGLGLAVMAAGPIFTATSAGAAPRPTPLQLAQQQESLTAGGPVDPGVAQPFSQPEAFGAQAPGDTPDSCNGPVVPSVRPMHWGYYPGYGCGPVPPAQTIYP